MFCKVAFKNVSELNPCFLFLLISTVNAALSDDCRTIEFQPETKDKYIENHMIRSMKVERKSACESHCFQEPNCVSYNFGLIDSDTPSCDLNSRTHLQVSSADFITKVGYTYRSILNPCQVNPCPSGFTCQVGFSTKGYRCVCPLGYVRVGEQCELVALSTTTPLATTSPSLVLPLTSEISPTTSTPSTTSSSSVTSVQSRKFIIFFNKPTEMNKQADE
ncbi:uncharacterized protein LOC144656408 [Oculina patagonica]